MKQDKNNKNQIVLYVMAENAFACFDISHIKKIIQISALEFVPGGPDYLVGMLNYGGKIIPVFDLAMLLGLKRISPYSLDCQMIVFTRDEINAGLIVDKIIKQGMLDETKIKFEEDLRDKKYLYEGIGEEDGRPVFILNIDCIIQDKLNLNINIPDGLQIMKETEGSNGK